MSKEQRFVQRNNHVRKLFYKTLEKNPKWRVECVIAEVANKVFLADRTVDAIINYEGIYAEKPKPESPQMTLF